MPRYRFQWSNLDEHLLAKLCSALRLPSGAPPETLRVRFGARPNTDFIQAAWPALLDEWLAGDAQARAMVAKQVRAAQLGDTSIRNDLAYLRSCRNTKSLREAVLTQFLAVGEMTQDAVPVAPPPKTRKTEPGPTSKDAAPPKTRKAEPVPTAKDVPPTLDEWLERSVAQILGVEHVQRDRDGDIGIRRGSSVTFIRALPGDMPGVKIFAPLLRNVQRTTKLYEAINEINLNFGLGKAVITPADEIVLSTVVLAESLTVDELGVAFDMLSQAADHYDTKIRDRFGGETWFEDEGEPVDV